MKKFLCFLVLSMPAIIVCADSSIEDEILAWRRPPEPIHHVSTMDHVKKITGVALIASGIYNNARAIYSAIKSPEPDIGILAFASIQLCFSGFQGFVLYDQGLTNKGYILVCLSAISAYLTRKLAEQPVQQHNDKTP